MVRVNSGKTPSPKAGRRLVLFHLLPVAVVALALCAGSAAQDPPDWVEVDYFAVLDQRKLTHSGEPVGQLLRRLGGRPVPPPGQLPEDRLRHSLLDPIAETYAFVLPDLIDTLQPLPDPPLVELAPLWSSGEPQPAWVELLRARHYVVESDGAGRLRLFLPYRGPDLPAAEAAERAYRDAWPVLRHLFSSERRRLGRGKESPPPLRVRAHAYMHARQLSRFRLGVPVYETTIDDTRPDGRRVPLDLDKLQAFLDAGLQLEGGRLDDDGRLRVLGSRSEARPTLVGEPLDLSDFAVAYRAVFHGGLAEPYMSLDRGFSPWTTLVNYGGRLRDTRLGMVSLLCDIRFKTFSMGLGIVEGADLREQLRQEVPDFRSHIEHFAAHPEASGILSQQTRLWFTPDSVDMTLSPQGDLLAVRSSRMNATSERVIDIALNPVTDEDPPWTRATIAAINDHYDELATIFPELDDLDQVVRLLSLFTWLQEASRRGLPVPELDALLALELPSVPTPRVFPRLLSFNALPQAASPGVVDTFDRIEVGDALERLHPTTGRTLPAPRRFERAEAMLDSRREDHARLLEEIRDLDPAQLDETALDFLAYRAERLRMHQTVLTTLEPEQRETVIAHQQPGTRPRTFSIGTGGLDLGMKPVMARATGHSLGLGSGVPGVVPVDSDQDRSSNEPPRKPTARAREAWRQDPAELPQSVVPDHGLPGSASRRELAGGWIELTAAEEGKPKQIWTALGAFGPEVTSRKVTLGPDGRARGFERVEGTRLIRYRLLREGDRWSAVKAAPAATPDPAAPASRTLFAGLGTLRVLSQPAPENEAPAVELQLEAIPAGAPRSLSAGVPRALLQRLVLGRALDPTPDIPLPGLDPLPASLGPIQTLMVLREPWQAAPPWDSTAPALVGEENPEQLARALGAWWQAAGTSETPSVVLGTSLANSTKRWESAPHPGAAALLLLPEDGFPGGTAAVAEELAASWPAEHVVNSLPQKIDSSLVILVSSEDPGLLARRLVALARTPSLEGKLLAVWSLAGPVRGDLPAWLLDNGGLAGFGLAEWSVVGQRSIADQLSATNEALSTAAPDLRVEQLPGPFLWYF